MSHKTEKFIRKSEYDECLAALMEVRANNIELRSELEQLRNYKAQMDEAMKFIMDEQCSASEKHCTCVPVLRQRVKELELVRQAAERVHARLANHSNKAGSREIDLVNQRELGDALFPGPFPDPDPDVIDACIEACKQGNTRTIDEIIEELRAAGADEVNVLPT